MGIKVNEEERRVRIFKLSPQSKKWSAELLYTDGTRHTFLTPHQEVTKARMLAVATWGREERKRNPPPSRERQREMEERLLSRSSSNGHADRPTAIPDDVLASGGGLDPSLMAKLRALVAVATAIEGLDGPTVEWIFETLRGLKGDLKPFPKPRPDSEARGSGI